MAATSLFSVPELSVLRNSVSACSLPPPAQSLIELNQREQLVSPRLSQAQFGNKQILIRIESVEHRVNAPAKSHIG